MPPDWKYSEPVEKPTTSPVWVSSSHFATYKVTILIEVVEFPIFTHCFSFIHKKRMNRRGHYWDIVTS
jgi:hypothetical protein